MQVLKDNAIEFSAFSEALSIFKSSNNNNHGGIDNGSNIRPSGGGSVMSPLTPPLPFTHQSLLYCNLTLRPVAIVSAVTNTNTNKNNKEILSNMVDNKLDINTTDYSIMSVPILDKLEVKSHKENDFWYFQVSYNLFYANTIRILNYLVLYFFWR